MTMDYAGLSTQQLSDMFTVLLNKRHSGLSVQRLFAEMIHCLLPTVNDVDDDLRRKML